MSAVSAYTDTDAIRSVLGLTARDIQDDMLLGMRLEDKLYSDLATWLADHATDYPTWAEPAASAALQNNARNLRLYATYYCATQVAAFQLAIPQSIGDGKNSLKRFEGMDFAALAQRMADEASLYRQRLEEAVNDQTQATLTLVGRAVPDYDPVTNT